MRIKIIGDNNCARATRHLLRLAGFAVSEFLPVDAITHAPHFGYAITIELAPAAHTPDSSLKPDPATHAQPADRHGEALSSMTSLSASDGASSRLFVESSNRVVKDETFEPNLKTLSGMINGTHAASDAGISPRMIHDGQASLDAEILPGMIQGRQAEAYPTGGGVSSCSLRIHFDSVDSLLEAAVLRHVTQLAADAVIVDRPGGVVHSERELRIVIPCSGDARADEAAAVAVELGVLRGLLDITSSKAAPVLFPASAKATAGAPASGKGTTWSPVSSKGASGLHDSEKATEGLPDEALAKSGGYKKKWWMLGVALVAGLLVVAATMFALGTHVEAAPGLSRIGFSLSAFDLCQSGTQFKIKCLSREMVAGVMKVKSRQAEAYPTGGARTIYVGRARSLVGVKVLGTFAVPPVAPLPPAAQEQFATGSAVKIFDGTNTLLVDPCKGQAKSYASINQTANTQIVAGTASKKIYVCSIHVVVAAATNVALVEGTGTVCGTSTAGVGGFGGATAATGWNFAANGGIAFGNGDSSLGAEVTSADNLCVFNSGSGQVSGGFSYVVQ